MKKLFDRVREALLIISDNIITDCNPSALDLFSACREQLVSRSPESLVPLYQSSQEHSSKLTKSYWQHLFREGYAQFELELLRIDETPFLADIDLSILEDGSVLAQIRDLTRERCMEKELHLQKAQFKATVESIPFDFWINDCQNRTYMQNHQSKKLWGDTRGKHYADVADSKETLLRWAQMNKAAMEGDTVEQELTYHHTKEPRYYRSIVAPVRDEEEIIGILGINIDITDYRNALTERETLLREIHHRVKNNLQIISSLINLDDHHDHFGEIENRINSIALIHDQLYSSDTFTHIQIASYIQELIINIESTFQNRRSQPHINLSCRDIALSIDQAIPLGIILNELISNSYKHNARDGEVQLYISFNEEEDSYSLSYGDNGPGKPGDPHLQQQSGLGLLLIRQLTAQLKGRVEFNATEHFHARLEFPR